MTGLPASFACRICDEPAPAERYRFRERMFGLNDSFEYLMCAACGCLQQPEPPTDWSRYYPPGYHSFQSWELPSRGVRAAVAAVRDRAHARGRPWAGLLGEPKTCSPHVRSLAAVRLSADSTILDVGCGTGILLAVLRRAGFRFLVGVDPLVPDDVPIMPGVRVLRRELSAMEGQFDLVMFHHVLEHVADQHGVMKDARRLLAPGGSVLVRVPTVDSDAWLSYGEDWVQLDAPRHVVLHSETSLQLLARRAQLSVATIARDSTGFQFWGSELYRRGIPLVLSSGAPTDPAAYFSEHELREFEAAARKLNAANRGDQLVAVLN